MAFGTPSLSLAVKWAIRGLLGTAVVILLAVGNTDQPHTPHYRWFLAAQPHTFNIAVWMANELILGSGATAPVVSADATNGLGSNPTAEYARAVATEVELAARIEQLERRGAPADAARAELTAARRRTAELAPIAERQLATLIGGVAAEHGLGWSFLDRLFPPVRFRFQSPPHMLVVSRRDAIGIVGAVPLSPELERSAMSAIEQRAEQTAVSALVVRIGGLATYPAMVPPSSEARWLVTTVAHEWMHNLFTLRPLGWRYAVGAEPDPRVIIMNETAADVAGSELGAVAYRRGFGTQPATAETVPVASPPNRLNAELRRVRQRVDELIERGEVGAAEEYMRSERDRLESEGLYLRRLNQAFFAFYGNYAEGPGGGPDPVVSDVKTLRRRAASLVAFVEQISGLSSYQELRELLASGR
ncbi:MAG: hypothetical protein HY329_21510 [Chloroflexi bacterium]|nr:hypothetical protein [Chloroflexota bacterium]